MLCVQTAEGIVFVKINTCMIKLIGSCVGCLIFTIKMTYKN